MQAFWKWTRVIVPFLCAPALSFIFQMSSRAAPQKAVELGRPDRNERIRRAQNSSSIVTAP